MEKKLKISWIMEEYKCSEEIAIKAYQGFMNFLNFINMSGLEFANTETELVSEKYRFGGCLDSLVRSHNGLGVGDFKTSSKVYPDMMIQIAAYGKAWDENFPYNPINGGYHLFRFDKENADFSHHYWEDLSDAWEQFKLFRQAYEIDKILKKRC